MGPRAIRCNDTEHIPILCDETSRHDGVWEDVENSPHCALALHVPSGRPYWCVCLFLGTKRPIHE